MPSVPTSARATSKPFSGSSGPQREAGDQAGQSREARPDERAVAVPQRAQRAVDLGSAAPLRAEPRQLTRLVSPDRQTQPVVGQDVERLDVVARAAGHDRMRRRTSRFRASRPGCSGRAWPGPARRSGHAVRRPCAGRPGSRPAGRGRSAGPGRSPRSGSDAATSTTTATLLAWPARLVPPPRSVTGASWSWQTRIAADRSSCRAGARRRSGAGGNWTSRSRRVPESRPRTGPRRGPRRPVPTPDWRGLYALPRRGLAPAHPGLPKHSR